MNENKVHVSNEKIKERLIDAFNVQDSRVIHEKDFSGLPDKSFDIQEYISSTCLKDNQELEAGILDKYTMYFSYDMYESYETVIMTPKSTSFKTKQEDPHPMEIIIHAHVILLDDLNESYDSMPTSLEVSSDPFVCKTCVDNLSNVE